MTFTEKMILIDGFLLLASTGAREITKRGSPGLTSFLDIVAIASATELVLFSMAWIWSQ